MTKKILITAGVILAAVVLIVVLLVVALLWHMYYITELEETKVNEFYSDDGQYTLTMYQIGEPAFPFGSVKGKFVLKKGNVVINSYDFVVSDDGCGLENNVPAIRWTDNKGGLATGMLFVDENVGFITISWGGEKEGAIYRTEDGGKTFEPSYIPSPMIEAENGTFYNPYVLPEKIYEEEGLLYLEVGQGAYKTYESEQWDYVGEVY